MNMCDAWVKLVLKEPSCQYGRWWVAVEYICEGSLGTTEIMCNTLEEALNVKEGYRFLA